MALYRAGELTPLDTLKEALRWARKHGLLREFKEGYRKYRAEGDGVHEATWCALNDWDL